MSQDAARGPFEPAFISIAEIIELHAKARPRDIAFSDFARSVTWKEFDAEISRVANSLLRRGIRKGDRIAALAGNSIWAYTVIFAVIRAGAVVCPLSPLLTPQLLANLASDCGATLMLVEHAYRQLAADCQAIRPQLQVICETGAGASYADLVAGSGTDNPNVPLLPDDRCNIIYSSGTTGRPKGIVHCHAARVGFAIQIGMGLRFHNQSRTLLSTSCSSNGTWMVMLPTVVLGGTTIVMGPFSSEAILRAIRQHRPTHAFIVPTQSRAILHDAEHGQVDFTCFECVVTGGSPMPDRIKDGMRELTGEKLYELWGFTESVGTIITPTEMAQRPHSVGRPWPWSEVRIIDEKGKDISDGGTGEIVGRTPSMMEGYLNRPDANDEIIWRDERGRVHFRTGDIGQLDSDGYLTLRGRAKDMILSGGQNVFPVDIEAVLLRHETVHDAAVVGVDDEKWGETPIGFVIPRAGANIDPKDLQDWANHQLAKFQRLSDVVVLRQDFPRNTLGKVLKNELKASYRVPGTPPNRAVSESKA